VSFSQAFWYRTGDLEPRFRNMLFYNTAVIISLSICTFMLFKETCPSINGTCPKYINETCS